MNPLLLILLLPIAEIALFIQVGDWIGLWPTVGLVVLSAVLGSVLVRRQGLGAMKRAQEAAERGEMPVGAVFEGFCIVAAGLLLIIPGFLTDAVGLLLLIRPLRNALGRWLFNRLRSRGSFHVWTSGGERPGHRPPPGVIDADFHEVPDNGAAPPGETPHLSDSRWGHADPRDRGDHRDPGDHRDRG